MRWRWIAFFSVFALVAVAASGARLLSFSNDYRIFFSAENPQLLAFENLQNTYTKSDNVLFVVAPADGNVYSVETLQAIEWLTEQAWQIPYSIRVDSLTNFQHTRADADELIVEDLVSDAANLSAQDLERIRGVASQEPLLVNRIVSPSGRVTGVNVIIQLPGVDPAQEVPEVVQFSRDLVRQVTERYPALDLHLTGVVLLNNAFSEMSLLDMQTLVPVMFGIIVLVLAVLLRSVWGTLATVLVILMSVATALGAAGWLGIKVTPPTAASPTMITTLAVANCVHLLVTFLQRARG
jgi:predicted RND superfamily exporter protein